MESERRVPNEEFVRRLTESQARLYAYILAVCGEPAKVQDILQETNVTLWRKAADFREDTSFWAWASRVAYFEILAHRKRCRKERLVFDDALLDDMTVEAVGQLEFLDRDLVMLHRCLDKLSESEQRLIRSRYSIGASVTRLAEAWGKSAAAISQALYRVRGRLAECIERERNSDAN